MPRILNFLAAISACAAAAGCATVPEAPSGSELVGHGLRVEAEGAPVTTLRFDADGMVRATVGTQQAAGRWEVANSQICVDFPRQGRECWHYRSRFEPGRPVALVSTGGATATVTLIP